MSSEPGLTLSRLIAAERNGLAAIEIARISRKDSADNRARIVQLEAEVASLKTTIEQMRMQLIGMIHLGSGPTAGS